MPKMENPVKNNKNILEKKVDKERHPGLPNIVAHVFSIVGLCRLWGPYIPMDEESRVRDDVPDFPRHSPRPIQGDLMFFFFVWGGG